jgi:hypothetical protein
MIEKFLSSTNSGKFLNCPNSGNAESVNSYVKRRMKEAAEERRLKNGGFIDDLPNDPLPETLEERKHRILHILWTKAVGTPDYDKSQWRELETLLLITGDQNGGS